MESTVNINIPLTVNQLAEVIRQLPKKEKAKLRQILNEDEEALTKVEVVKKIKEGLDDVKLHKEGKVKLETLEDFLADV